MTTRCTTRRGIGRRAALAWTIGAMLVAVPARAAEIIDRVMAVVNGSIVTLSDVQAGIRLGVVAVPAGPGRDTAVLDKLIERRLTLTEVNRYGPGEPSAAVVDERLRAVRARFTSEEALTAVLAEVGVTPDQLRTFVRDDVRIETYIQQRFAGGAPTEAEILEYYRAHPEAFMRGGLALTYQEAHDDARAAVIRERRERLAQEWIAGLRRRADVTIPAIVRK